MGIFSRIFQRGQDGSASDAADENGNAMNDEHESAQTAGRGPAHPSPPVSPQAPPVSPPVSPQVSPQVSIDEPPAPSPPKLPGLTPAFAGASTAVPHTPAEPARSMWDWPGPTREPRRSNNAASSNASSNAASSNASNNAASSNAASNNAASNNAANSAAAGSSFDDAPPPPATPSEPPRTPPRAGGLPSVPRNQPVVVEATKPETSKERDSTMVLSPPPAPSPPSTPAPLPGLPPRTRSGPSPNPPT